MFKCALVNSNTFMFHSLALRLIQTRRRAGVMRVKAVPANLRVPAKPPSGQPLAWAVAGTDNQSPSGAQGPRYI